MEIQKYGWVCGPAAVLLSFIIILPILWFGFGADHGLFAYCVWVWRQFGLVPYKDTFNQSFPGIFLITYFVQATMGESITAFRVFDLFWQTATVIIIYFSAASIFKNRLAGFMGSVLYAIFYLNLGPWHTGQRDDFFLLLYLLGMWLLIRGKGRREIPCSIITGLLIGFAFLIKPVAAGVVLVLLALIALTMESKFRSALAYVGGCAAPSLAVILYYWHLNGLGDLYNSLFYFTGKVYLDYQLDGWPKVLAGIFMTKNLRTNLFIGLGAILLIPLRKRIGAKENKCLFWLLLILLASYAGYFFQAKYSYNFYYHEAPVWGLLCVMAGGGWAFFINFVNHRTGYSNSAKTAAICGMLILFSILSMRPYHAKLILKALGSWPKAGQDLYSYQHNCQEAARYIRNSSAPDDKLQVWGGEAFINFLARRRAPTRFASTLHLIPFRPGPGSLSPLQKKWGAELLAGMETDPPLYFFVARLPYFDNPDISITLKEDYPEIWDFVRNNYRLVNTISGAEIYLRAK